MQQQEYHLPISGMSVMEVFDKFCHNDSITSSNNNHSISQKQTENSQDLGNKWMKLIGVNRSRLKFRTPILKKIGRQTTISDKLMKYDTFDNTTTTLKSNIDNKVKNDSNLKRATSQAVLNQFAIIDDAKIKVEQRNFDANFSNIKLIDEDSETENLHSFQDFETKSCYNFDENFDESETIVTNRPHGSQDESNSTTVHKFDIKENQKQQKYAFITNCFPF